MSALIVLNQFTCPFSFETKEGLLGVTCSGAVHVYIINRVIHERAYNLPLIGEVAYLSDKDHISTSFETRGHGIDP